MFIFFVKFSFLVTAFNLSNIFICFLILLNLMGGMFFYMQVFKLSKSIDSKLVLATVTQNSPLRLRGNALRSQDRFRFVFWSVVFLFFSWFSGVFFLDLYILVDNILV
jgi:hypothetical protein